MLLLQAAAQLRKQQQKLETALGRAQQEASALSTQLGAAQKDAAAAKAMLSMSSGRNALVEKAWQAAQEDAASLRAQQRSMQAALSSAQREARTLAAELEMARAQQQQEQQGGWQSDQPDQDLGALRSRVSMVEKAWTQAAADAKEQHVRHSCCAVPVLFLRIEQAALQYATLQPLPCECGVSARAVMSRTCLKHSPFVCKQTWHLPCMLCCCVQAQRVEAERELAATQREVWELTRELEDAQAAVASSAAGVETAVAQLPDVVGHWRDGPPRELAHYR
jgi:chromosome segregation ATPase